MSDHIMLDLETLGTRPGSVVLSIGAVRFNATEITDEFSVDIKVQSSLDRGFAVDGATLTWWLGQTQEALKQFSETRVSVDAALEMFGDWCGRKSCVWGNGVSFDNALLADAYRRIDVSLPWDWRNDRCYRTLRALCPEVEYVKPTVAHNALSDATAQANHAMKCFSFLGGKTR